MAQPKNSESQAKMGSRNPANGVCDKNSSHKRLLHWRDVEQGNLDCTAPGCNGHYRKR
mgnify:CR=1 FL=1